MGTALVTGANRGIGLELVRQFRAQGLDVIAVCRTSSSELARLGVRVEAGVDVADARAVRELAQRLAGVELDVLVNNAGMLREDGLTKLDFDAIEEQLRVNALGPLRVTQALRANL